MTTDPFRCDALFSLALLAAFVSLSPALFTVTLPDWIIITEKAHRRYLCSKNGTECALDRNSTAQNSTDDLDQSEVETTLGTVTNAVATANVTSQYDDNSIPEAATRKQAEHDHERRSSSETILLVNLQHICIRNSSTKTLNCEPITNANVTQGHVTCDRDGNVGSSWTFEDDIDCNLQAIRKSMFGFVQYAFPCMISASILNALSAMILNGFAVADKGYLALKIPVGLTLLGSATLQIFILLQLRLKTANLELSDDAEVRQGAAIYFSSTSCAMTVIASALLFISSFKEKPSSENSTKSNADVPFQSNQEYNVDESQDFDEFMKVQEDESEEWGFNPKANDMPNEVKFRLLKNIPATYLTESETDREDISRTSKTCDQKTLSEPPALKESDRKNQFEAEDRNGLTSFSSGEFLAEEGISSSVTEEPQSKIDTSVKRVVFLLPEVSDESVEECAGSALVGDQTDAGNLRPQTLLTDQEDATANVNPTSTENEHMRIANSDGLIANNDRVATDNIRLAPTNDLQQQTSNELTEERRPSNVDGTNVDYAESSSTTNASQSNSNATTCHREESDDGFNGTQ